ncbi:hypothetical protein S40288_01257 [Stachybotrys chartarum IBT 40288]|nr:hypothetical protein S40288_01257 [Stachybotrys chartarum IBT 40288]
MTCPSDTTRTEKVQRRQLPCPPAATTKPRNKWHTKSRTGCQACKARKVKCDEYRPSCRNCTKRGVKCDFLLLDQGPSTPPVPSPASLELELLHNWTVATSATFAVDPQVRDVWRVLVPQAGFSTRYILDGLLALSALHMARHDQARRDMLLDQATQYQVASLNEALPLMSTVTSQNCSNLFLFGALTLYTYLASPKSEDDMLVVGNGGIPQWLFLIRGIAALIVGREEVIWSSASSLIFRSTTEGNDFWETHEPPDHEPLDELQAVICRRTAADQPRQDILVAALQDLKRSYTFLTVKTFGDDHVVRGFYNWLSKVSDEFLKLLRDGDNEALCVFAFFTVLLRSIEKFWWIEGWAIHLIRRIYYLLDEEYRLLILWPIQELGWVPERRL